MKNSRNLWIAALVLVLFSSVRLHAQEEDHTIKVKIQKEINGQMTTVEKTYKNVKEMKNDPDLKDMDIQLFDGNGFFFSNGDKGNINVTIQKEDTEGIHTDKNHFFFKMDDDDNFEWKSESNNIEVIKDEKGDVTILKNGKPIDKDNNVTIHKFNSTDIDDIKHIKVKKIDNGGKVIIINGDKEIEWQGDNEMKEEVEVLINSLRDTKNANHSSTSTIQISIKKVKIHIEDIAKKDEALKALNLDNKRELKLQDLSYYPNPTEGKFKLSFHGKSVPTEIRIRDLTGKTVFRDIVSDFQGQYSDDIDLSSESNGIYIMQVIQGNRTLNKKIVIE